MDSSTLIYSVLIGAALIGLLYFLYRNPKKPVIENKQQPNSSSISLQLQAYERLILLVDRIAIPNLISRMGNDGSSARDMQLMLTRSIRDEFDYNITQQIYINPQVWNAVKNLKEKNLLIINQVASILPPNASGLDLNRALLELLIKDSKSNLHELVSEALSYEAKKLL